jgi:hypothetical protein
MGWLKRLWFRLFKFKRHRKRWRVRLERATRDAGRLME